LPGVPKVSSPNANGANPIVHFPACAFARMIETAQSSAPFANAINIETMSHPISCSDVRFGS
jgi:hypothetical protein